MYITDNSKLAHLFNNHYINIVENTSGMPPEFFFLLGFSSQTLTIHRTAGEGRGPSFIPLYHFDLLTNIRHLFATLYVRWLSHIFNCNACVYQTATQWDLPPYWMTIWVIDWWCNVCLLDELILGFCYSDLTLETSRFELALTITLVLHVNRLTKCASHPKCASDVCNQVCWWCVYKTKLNPNILRYISTYILSCRIKKKKKKEEKKKHINCENTPNT